MNYTQEINTIIERALTEKTFNLEIIEEIKKLRELPEKLEEANKMIEEIRKENTRLTTDNEALLAKADDVSKREKEVTEAERKQELQNVRNEANKEILKEYKDVMSLVFRNTTVRENIYSNKQIQVTNNGYSSQMPESESIDREVRTE